MITVTNGGQTSVSLSAISVSNPAYAVSGVTLPVSLPAGQSLDVNLIFQSFHRRMDRRHHRFCQQRLQPGSPIVGVGGTGSSFTRR